jgi:exonuclease V
MQIGQEKDQEDSSDYGSDFTPDEEVLLTQLLERADHHQQTQPATPPRQTAPAEVAAQLSDLKEPLLVTDIEDNELPHSARIPKVLGREAWSPAAKRRQQQQQQQPKLLSSPSKAPEHELLPISGMWSKSIGLIVFLKS